MSGLGPPDKVAKDKLAEEEAKSDTHMPQAERGL